MEPSNAVRQVEEILTLKDQYYKDAIEIKTPQLFNRLSRVGPKSVGRGGATLLEVKKCLSFYISCGTLYPDELDDLLLEFTFPLDYPSESTCNVRALSAKAVQNSSDSNENEGYESCTRQIEQYLKSFCGYECVELTLDWVAQNKNTCLLDDNSSKRNDHSVEGGSSDNAGDDRLGKVKCYVLRYNHLLEGPEHKKEKAMIDAAKKARLQGGLLWGTPGVVVVVPPTTEDDAKEYASECRTIGKRADGVEEIWLPQVGIDEAGLGGLAQQKRGGKLQELNTVGLRSACGGDEDLLRSVLGVR
mmetsp:Transcript_74/g.110  ORF Transcript_74/g.110 Transcript_74/m.110 type:complete len:302 (-) Transcript_74:229-1134(-)